MEYQLIIDDFICEWGFNKRNVRYALAPYNGKPVNVKISSLGGDLNHALDIMQQFKDHGDVTVYFTGMSASAATVIALGAKHINICQGAAILVHKCSNFIDAWGNYNADQMQELINKLTENKEENEKIDVILAGLYADRSHKSINDIMPIMKKGGWLSPQEALEYGFVDEIVSFVPDNTSKVNLDDLLVAKLNSFGLPTSNLAALFGEKEADTDADDSASVDDTTAEHQPINQNSSMKNFKFNTVASLLKVDAITPDNDGYVSIKAEEFEQINNELETLGASVTAKANEVTVLQAKANELQSKIDELTSQVDALKKSPADDSVDIIDEGEDNKLNCHDLFNSIKGSL